MKPNLPLAIGLILNLVRLLILHSPAEKWLQDHLKLPHWFWHFVGGAACALMLWGCVLLLRPEVTEKLRAFKNHLLGGN